MTSDGESVAGYNVPVACTLDAIPADERSAHCSLAAQLFGQLIQEHRELADGHEFRFRLESLEALARFIANERKCCPFVNVDLAIVAGSVGFFLVLRSLTFAGHALSHVGFAGATGSIPGATARVKKRKRKLRDADRAKQPNERPRTGSNLPGRRRRLRLLRQRSAPQLLARGPQRVRP